MKEKLPHVDKFIWELNELGRLLKQRDLLVGAYKMALDLGLDPRSGSEGGVDVGGSFALRPDGSVTGYVPEAVVGDTESPRPPPSEQYRWVARTMFKQLKHARLTVNNVLATANDSRLGADVRQIRPDDKGVPDPELLRRSLKTRCARDGHVWPVQECKVCGQPKSREAETG